MMRGLVLQVLSAVLSLPQLLINSKILEGHISIDFQNFDAVFSLESACHELSFAVVFVKFSRKSTE